MPKFKLLCDHYIGEQVLKEGTVVGEGSAFPFTGAPSSMMEGLDEASKKAVEARMKSFNDPEKSIPVKGV